MKRKLWRLAAALLPFSFLSAQQPSPSPANAGRFPQPSPEVLNRIAQQRERMRAHAEAINQLAAHIQSPDDARKLVDLIAAEFSDELPSKWAVRSIRNRIARAEYESAAEPGALIPEQRVADAWNDFLQKIGAPQQSYVTAAEIHTLRDSYYVTSQLSWARGNQNIWTVPAVYAVAPDAKVANGCRALEVLNIIWQLANQPQILDGTRELIKRGELLSNLYRNPSKPPAPGSETAHVAVSLMPPNPVEQAARRYAQEHGARALDRAIQTLLTDLYSG